MNHHLYNIVLFTPTVRVLALLAFLSTLGVNHQLSASTPGTAFTYQGRLTDGNQPANGLYDFRFSVMVSPDLGVPLDTRITNGVPVSNGLFMVTLDFGAEVFDGSPRWLEIEVKTNNVAGPYTLLSPRQELTSAPYAILAGNISGSLPATGLSGTYSRAVTLDNAENLFNGNFTGDGGGLTNVNAGTLEGLSAAGFWKVSGNADTSPGVHFLGTVDNQPVELRVNNTRALRLQPTDGAPNVIGGSENNVVGEGVTAAVIGGGSENTIQDLASWATIAGGWGNVIRSSVGTATIGGGAFNRIEYQAGASSIGGGQHNTIHSNALVSTISGGYWNAIQADAYESTIGGGGGNTIHAAASSSTIGGGVWNIIQTNAHESTVSGGRENNIGADSEFSAIGGGQHNIIGSNSLTAVIAGGGENSIGYYSSSASIAGGVVNGIGDFSGESAIGGGGNNTIGNNSFNATIAGGIHNAIDQDAPYSVVGGGRENSVASNSWYSTVVGGYQNVIGVDSDFSVILGGEDNSAGAGASHAFAAGQRAKANHTGSFVWADVTASDFATTGPNQFLIRASGGVGIGTPLPRGQLDVTSAGSLPQLRLEQMSGSDWARIRMGVNGGTKWDISVGAGATPSLGFYNGTYNAMILDYYGNLTITGTYSPSSDRAVKQEFAPVNPQEILERVARLPLQSWAYTNRPSVRHLGPVAQDFHAAFGLGADDKHIATVDADGVALAAIQGLNQKLTEELQRRDAENRELRRELAELRQLINSLISQSHGGGQ